MTPAELISKYEIPEEYTAVIYKAYVEGIHRGFQKALAVSAEALGEVLDAELEAQS